MAHILEVPENSAQPRGGGRQGSVQGQGVGHTSGASHQPKTGSHTGF